MYVQICTVYCMVLKTLASYGGREVVTYKCYWNPSSYPQHPKIKVSGKTVMKWDKFKKRYTLQKVDREGKVMAERRNEAGKVIKKNDKHEDIYKKWQ